MRAITEQEMDRVYGGTGECTPDNTSGNNYGGITDTSTIGGDLIAVYEGLVSATSHIIERVADAL